MCGVGVTDRDTWSCRMELQLMVIVELTLSAEGTRSWKQRLAVEMQAALAGVVDPSFMTQAQVLTEFGATRDGGSLQGEAASSQWPGSLAAIVFAGLDTQYPQWSLCSVEIPPGSFESVSACSGTSNPRFKVCGDMEKYRDLKCITSLACATILPKSAKILVLLHYLCKRCTKQFLVVLHASIVCYKFNRSGATALHFGRPPMFEPEADPNSTALYDLARCGLSLTHGAHWPRHSRPSRVGTNFGPLGNAQAAPPYINRPQPFPVLISAQNRENP
ncbi:hypothetical protein B0H17DRAFT_1147337 [Mycena rosella]|uniref:Uncharacterized protein n=1 Tax=Mycena rosella TaxID=1033263 RepID=A0AAD7CM13_MYCRO|nr:hypothetical protein B0H17DRAFT_1147337 [Mycena rosella]